MAPRKILGKVEPVQKVWLNKKEAMAYLGCKEDFLRKLRENAEIKFSQYGGKMVWYELQSINRFIERHRVL